MEQGGEIGAFLQDALGILAHLNKRHHHLATDSQWLLESHMAEEWVVAEAGKSSNCGGGLSFEFAPSGA